MKKILLPLLILVACHHALAMEEGMTPWAKPQQIQLEPGAFEAVRQACANTLEEKFPHFASSQENWHKELALYKAARQFDQQKKDQAELELKLHKKPKRRSQKSIRDQEDARQEPPGFSETLKAYEQCCEALARHVLYFSTINQCYPKVIKTWDCQVEDFDVKLKVRKLKAGQNRNDALVKDLLEPLKECLSQEYTDIIFPMKSLWHYAKNNVQMHKPLMDFTNSLVGLITSYKILLMTPECQEAIASNEREIHASWRSLLHHAGVIFSHNITVVQVTPQEEPAPQTGVQPSWVYKICNRYVDRRYVSLGSLEAINRSLDK